jgi:glycosyltransferase involved in cell wall biosynthesis
LRLLYLGFAWPPGVQALYPGLNPAGHAFETRMVTALREGFEIRSVGLLPLAPPPLPSPAPDSGLAHDLLLLEKAPELFYRFRALSRLKRQYRSWRAQGWEPDAVLVYNLSPVYNQFVLWLERQPACPKRVLLLLDSPNLGRRLPWAKRFRRRFKPMVVPDAEMVLRFDACIGLSQATAKYFEPRQIPFLWMPGGTRPDPVQPDEDDGAGEPGRLVQPRRFGYFGALAPHAGIGPLIEHFLGSQLPASLEVCGYGKMGNELAALAHREPRLKFHGLLPTSEDCLRFGRSCHVLVNPRPDSFGNENSFASKLFEYALCGRAILTSRLPGVEAVLGPDAFYFEPSDFTHGLRQRLQELSAVDPGELDRRGAAIRKRVLREFSWSKQAARISQFLAETCLGCLPATTPRTEAVAA